MRHNLLGDQHLVDFRSDLVPGGSLSEAAQPEPRTQLVALGRREELGVNCEASAEAGAEHEEEHDPSTPGSIEGVGVEVEAQQAFRRIVLHRRRGHGECARSVVRLVAG